MADLKTSLIAFMRGQGDLGAVDAALREFIAHSPERAPAVGKMLEKAREAGLHEGAYETLTQKLDLYTAPPQEFPDTLMLSSSPMATGAKPSESEPAEPEPEPVEDEFIETLVLPTSPARQPPSEGPTEPSERIERIDDTAPTVPNPAAVEAERTVTLDEDETFSDGPEAASSPSAREAGDGDRTVVLTEAEKQAPPPPPVPPPSIASRLIDPDATVLATDDDAMDPDATVLASADDVADPDATVLADDDADITALGADAGPSGAASEDSTERDVADHEDATEVDVAGDHEDATEVNVAGDHEDATEVNVAGEDATAINVAGSADEDATAVNVAGRDEGTTVMDEAFDILAADSMAAAEGATGASSPTSVETSGAGIDREFREGDLLRGRFQLTSKLGEGGMGAVWKGIDKLKEEARDRNPYVAIKLLQGDFKEHPEAFIALQRETAKQQRLAHPNIATVFDFDRDDATNTVFMTMEVLEGQPLDAFVRKLPADGMAVEDAMPLIEHLCNGLAYAHSHQLVHSDLKPGNCFLTKENSIKLLDFGIARASKTKGEAEGETTLFDPGQLGALTPTYATIEMFDGQDPDTRDDIYALAIMTYQLFTGKHPYGKKSAPKAKELGLVPEPVAKLDKRQNKALARGLAFLREDRTDTVEEFLEGITKRKSRAGLYAVAASVLLVVIGALAFNPVVNLINEKKRDAIVQVIAQGDLQSMSDGLAQADAWGDPEQIALILDNEQTQAAITGFIAGGDEQSILAGLALIEPYDDGWEQGIRDETWEPISGHFYARARDAFSPDDKRYDFPGAAAAIGELDTLYPDSARVLQFKNEFAEDKESALSTMGEAYKSLRDAGALVPTEGQDDVGDVLAIIGQIDPEHRLLTDKELVFAFAGQAEAAIESSDYALADAFLQASVTYAPEDAVLKDLRYQVTTELQRLENEKRVAEVQGRLEQQLAGLESLEDFQQVRDDLIVLADLSPTNPVLNRIQKNLKQAFAAALDRNIEAADWGAAEALLVDYAKLLEVPYLTERRALLSQAEQSAGFTLPATAEREASVAERMAEVDTLLANPEFTSDWEIRLKGPYKELIALLPFGDPQLEPVRNGTARLYLDQAQQAREAGSFAEALAFVDKGLIFYPGLKNFDDEVAAIDAAKVEAELQRKEEQRITRIANLKTEFEEKAGRDDTAGAREVITQLESERLEDDDTFLTEQAPAMLAQAYLNTAAKAAESSASDAYKNALTLAKAGFALAPENEALAEAVASYTEEVANRMAVTGLGELFKSSDALKALDVASVGEAMKSAQSRFPDEYADFRKGWAADRSDSLLAYAQKGDKIEAFADRVSEFERLFPEEKGAVRKQAAEMFDKRIRGVGLSTADAVRGVAKMLNEFKALSAERHKTLTAAIGADLEKTIEGLIAAKDLEQAGDLLAAARPSFPALGGILIEVARAKQLRDEGKLNAAAAELDKAKAIDPSHAEIGPMASQITEMMDAVLREYAKIQEDAKKASTKDQPAFDKRVAEVRDQWSDNSDLKKVKIEKRRKTACTEDKVGLGAKRGGSCYDGVTRKKGPALVVVPAGGGVDSTFAIGKFEVTVADYNLFCKVSKQCKRVKGNGKLPITGIGLAEAEAYASWLSEEASKSEKKTIVYRLPSEAEWVHAAKANGAPKEKKFTCRVEGVYEPPLQPATNGSPNGWGLINYIGNAQEWVKTGGGVAARGGNFEDPLAKCDVELSRTHSGSADEKTGFRLVRELG